MKKQVLRKTWRVIYSVEGNVIDEEITAIEMRVLENDTHLFLDADQDLVKTVSGGNIASATLVSKEQPIRVIKGNKGNGKP